ncbi:MAG: hypothetical protein OXU21_13420 [Chloroflexota bacterium]|nr:hypothetical protein [Chloroflexota bacterium]
MTPELIGILSVGVALFVGLGGLILTVAARANTRIDRLEDRFDSLEARIDTLSERVARIEGVIEGLFAGMNGRRTAKDKEAAA